MGYDLHITRKTNWADKEGPEIFFEEWRALVQEDRELSIDSEVGQTTLVSFGEYKGAFHWSDGEITSKNPEQEIIVKMVALARALGAQLQGDDGEVYGEDGEALPEQGDRLAKPPGLLQKICGWWRARRTAHALRADAPKFKIGSRVRNPWGVRGTVIEIDMKAEHGLGVLVVRTDNGSETRSAFIASGWELEQNDGKPGVRGEG